MRFRIGKRNPERQAPKSMGEVDYLKETDSEDDLKFKQRKLKEKNKDHLIFAHTPEEAADLVFEIVTANQLLYDYFLGWCVPFYNNPRYLVHNIIHPVLAGIDSQETPSRLLKYFEIVLPRLQHDQTQFELNYEVERRLIDRFKAYFEIYPPSKPKDFEAAHYAWVAFRDKQ